MTNDTDGKNLERQTSTIECSFLEDDPTNEYRAPGWFWFQERISYRSVVELILPKFVEIVGGNIWDSRIWKGDSLKKIWEKNDTKTTQKRTKTLLNLQAGPTTEKVDKAEAPAPRALAPPGAGQAVACTEKACTESAKHNNALLWSFSMWNLRPWSASQPMPKVTIFHSISRTDQLISVAPCWLVDFAFSRSNFPPKCLDFEVYKFVFFHAVRTLGLLPCPLVLHTEFVPHFSCKALGKRWSITMRTMHMISHDDMSACF